jgi:hypothetical protein
MEYGVSEVITASIIKAMRSVNFYQTTRRNIPKDSHPHTRRRENLKCHSFSTLFSLVTQRHPLCDDGVEEATTVKLWQGKCGTMKNLACQILSG